MRTISLRSGLIAGLASLLLVSAFFATDRLLPAGAPGGSRYQYDGEGRVVRRAAPDGRVARLAYDAAGQLVKVSYHRTGGLTGWAYPSGGSVRFGYDPAGNRIEVEDGTGTTRTTYDELGRPSGVTAPDGATLSYAYDPWGRVHRITYPDGTRTEYGHDLFGQLVRVSDGQGEVRYEHHGSASRIVRTLPNGVVSVFQRTPAGRLAAIEHRKADGSLLAAFHYAYDPEGRVRAVEERTPRGVARTEHEYDLLGRLVRVAGPDGQTSYEYDALGNRTAETGPRGTVRYQYDAEGRLVQAGEVRFAYDALGNLASREGGGRSVEYEYDAEGRLVEVRTDKATVRYAYDGEGHRVEREVDGEVVRSVHHRFTPLPQVLAELDAEGRLARRYLLGSSRLAQTGPDGRTVYLLEDHLGSTRCLVDAAGQVVARYSYSPFGAPRRVEGSEETAFLFAGEEWDAEAGLLYLRARYYDPEIGRFLSPDPLDGRPEDPQSFNQYAYAANDPVNRTDPTGLQPGWPPPPPPTYYDPYRYQRPWWQSLVYSRYDTPHLDPRYHALQSHHWLYYFPGHVWSSAVRGELFRPTYERDYFFRAILQFTGIGSGVLTINDLLYYRAHGDLENATATGLPTVLDLWLKSRNPALGGIVSNLTTPAYAGLELLDSRTVQDSLFRGLDSFTRRLQEARDPLSYMAELDPILAGTLDRSRNVFFPPPPGGGGGGLPLVGGVYLDQTAKVIGELGTITGAVYDAESGRIILVGDRRTALPPMRLEYFAAALRAVYSESPHEPGMTIDPHPQDPHAPVMLVIFFGNTENTRLGWVMFEADRIMKGYSVGRDNLTREPVRSRIPGYRSLTAMGLAGPGASDGLWSRFWLVPEPIQARVSDDGQGILFDPIRLRVQTETMRWAGGRLVPAGAGIRDAHAEAFAEHFTARYDDFAREKPVYAELRQVTAAVALAKWMKERGIPIDWSFVRIASRPFPTPTTTPAAFTQETKSWTEGLALRSLTISSFGGVEMTPRLQPRKDPAGNAFRKGVAEAWAAAQREGKEVFSVRLGEHEHRAVALPGSEQREVASYSLAETDLPGAAARLPGLPGLVRSYDSLHNEPTEIGQSWSLLLPHLDFEAADAGGESQYLSVEGDPATRVLVQRFVLSNAFGLGQIRFREHFIDQELGRIGFKPERSTVYRGLYPEGEGLYRLFFTGGDQALFDEAGRLRALLTPTTRAIYEYDEAGRLAALRFTSEAAPGQAVDVLYGWDGQGRLASISAGAETAAYEYDRAGNLARVRSSGGTVAYRYNGRRLLTGVTVDGRNMVENRYDTAGRLVEQRHGRAGTLRQTVEPAPDGGRIVTAEQGGHARKRRYDAQLRLMSEEDPDGSTRSFSYTQGRLAAVDAVLPTGGKLRVELDEHGKVKTVADPRGARTEVRYHPDGSPAELLVNGRRRAACRYGPGGQLAEVGHEGGWREDFAWDGAGRLAEYRRSGPGAGPQETADAVRLAYDAQGDVTAVESPSLGRTDILRQPGAVTIARDGIPVREIRAARNPDGSLHWIETVEENRRWRLEIRDRSVVHESPIGARTRLVYGTAGQLETVEDPLGGKASYVYDENGRLRQAKLPGGSCREYTYDPEGRLTARISCGNEKPAR